MTGLLLVNLGTPEAPTPAAVRRYLAEFLSDPRVIDIPAVPRWLLLNLVILPFRPAKSAAAYQKVWGPEGSPLLVHSRALATQVQASLGQGWKVELGMRYAQPDLPGALARLQAAGVDRIVVLPLYPQHASSSTGSTLERVYGLAAAMPAVPALSAVPAFYDDPAFLAALQATIAPSLAALFPTPMGDADHVLFSFHGLPERQVRATDPSGAHCLASPACCDAPSPHNRDCYRFQCFATARALARGLGLPADRWSVSFQSRLGRTPWIQPFTDEHLPALYGRGVRRLLVSTPSFVADCLETVEEIGIRARQQWAELGGADFALAPCLNSDPSWAAAVADLARRAVGHR